MKKIVIIVGPTCVGKTEIGINLAEKFDGEIINADSRQVYRGLDIGTSKSLYPHHLVDVCNPDERWSAARFQQEADRCIEQITERGKTPFVVGGTGLYVRALLHGLFCGPPADPKIRARLEGEIRQGGLPLLYEKLKRNDPVSVLRINQNDSARIIRALEVCELTGQPISAHQKKHGFCTKRYEYLKLGIKMERKELREKINKRVEGMITAGLEEEARRLAQKYGEDSLLAKAIGYGEWFKYFSGETTRTGVIETIKKNTHHFAKRQETWFGKEPDVIWFESRDLSGMENAVEKFLGFNKGRFPSQ